MATRKGRSPNWVDAVAGVWVSITALLVLLRDRGVV
jgi:hypothetical protein